jgi:RNA-directed DNA polymerase
VAVETEARDNRRGIPQGSPISPLLANLYMRGWKMLGLEQSLGSRIVTYADDLVILCRKDKAEEALQRLREIMGKLKLTVNDEKTRICKVPEEEFDFLGYTFGQMYSARTGKSISGSPAIAEEHQAHGGNPARSLYQRFGFSDAAINMTRPIVAC